MEEWENKQTHKLSDILLLLRIDIYNITLMSILIYLTVYLKIWVQFIVKFRSIHQKYYKGGALPNPGNISWQFEVSSIGGAAAQIRKIIHEHILVFTWLLPEMKKVFTLIQIDFKIYIEYSTFRLLLKYNNCPNFIWFQICLVAFLLTVFSNLTPEEIEPRWASYAYVIQSKSKSNINSIASIAKKHIKHH